MSTVNQNAALSALFSLECSWLKDEERYYAENLLKEDVASDEDGMSEEDEEKEREPADIPTAELKPSNYRDLRVLRDVLTSMPTVNSKPEEAEEPAEAKDEEDHLQCITCDKEIERDSHDHDGCMLVNKGDDLICADCPRVCEPKCGECPVCEEEEEEEEELAGHLCAGASDPATVITYTMAGGGAHWWEYEVHYDADGQQTEVYINDTDGHEYLLHQVLFYYEDQPDQLRVGPRCFDEDKWVLLEHHA